jgi:MocE subfamily Rieske [2Fe-2S] domain protein
MFLKCFNYRAFRRFVVNVGEHCLGRVTAEEATFIPRTEFPRLFRRARIYAAIVLSMVALCVYYQTWLPFVFVLGPNLYGAWLMPVYGWTQHTGLAENVLDHRLNCRTIHMNVVHRFLYWNMNYHLEHHMFPMVPFHQLPRLHTLVRDDCPEPYPSLWAAYREIVPTVLRQISDPGYFVRRKLPASARPVGTRPTMAALTAAGRAPIDGWIDVGAADLLAREDVLRFDHDHHTYAIYRTARGTLHATDGMCTHGNTHLADGLVTGAVVECPKHNGRFDVTTGEPRRLPACVALRTHRVREVNGRIELDVTRATEPSALERTYTFRVVSNRNVTTFIKELVLAPLSIAGAPDDRVSGTGYRVPQPRRVSGSGDRVSEHRRDAGDGSGEPHAVTASGTTADSRLPTADSRLRTAASRLPTADCRAETADSRLPTAGSRLSYLPGQYLQIHVPAYGDVRFADIGVDEPYAAVWRAHHLFDLRASNTLEVKRNYSIAANPAIDGDLLRFNVRIATPPVGQDCDAGAGSSWVWALRPGDTVTASGPYGGFLVRDSDREVVYVGGGAGMAPIRAHLSYLLETLRTRRRVSYWYGARSRQEMFYEPFFRDLEARFPNFRFHVALSSPLPDDDWTGHTGFIHDVLRREYLAAHPDPSGAEYFLCGPPLMVHAAREMLRDEFGVAPADIVADEF